MALLLFRTLDQLQMLPRQRWSFQRCAGLPWPDRPAAFDHVTGCHLPSLSSSEGPPPHQSNIVWNAPFPAFPRWPCHWHVLEDQCCTSGYLRRVPPSEGPRWWPCGCCGGQLRLGWHSLPILCHYWPLPFSAIQKQEKIFLLQSFQLCQPAIIKKIYCFFQCNAKKDNACKNTLCPGAIVKFTSFRASFVSEDPSFAYFKDTFSNITFFFLKLSFEIFEFELPSRRPSGTKLL